MSREDTTHPHTRRALPPQASWCRSREDRDARHSLAARRALTPRAVVSCSHGRSAMPAHFCGRSRSASSDEGGAPSARPCARSARPCAKSASVPASARSLSLPRAASRRSKLEALEAGRLDADLDLLLALAQALDIRYSKAFIIRAEALTSDGLHPHHRAPSALCSHCTATYSPSDMRTWRRMSGTPARSRTWQRCSSRHW